jgi:hypothetical protein
MPPDLEWGRWCLVCLSEWRSAPSVARSAISDGKIKTKLALFMNTCCVVRSSRPAGLFSFGFFDGLSVRPRWPYVREAPSGFGLERLATAFMNSPG